MRRSGLALPPAPMMASRGMTGSTFGGRVRALLTTVLTLMAICSVSACDAAGPPSPTHSSAADRSGLPEIVTDNAIRVCSTGDYRPFTYRDPQGNWNGLDIDMAHNLADHLGVRLDLVPTTWANLLTDVGKPVRSGQGLWVSQTLRLLDPSGARRASYAGTCAAWAAAINWRMRSGLLTPGAVSTPDETSTIVAPVAAMAAATLSGVSPPDEHERHAIPDRRDRTASRTRGRCRPAARRRDPRRLRIEQDELRNLGVVQRQLGVAGRLDLDRLDHRAAPAAHDLGGALRRLGAMELEHVGFDSRHDPLDRRIVGVDDKRDDARAAAREFGKLGGRPRARGCAGSADRS